MSMYCFISRFRSAKYIYSMSKKTITKRITRSWSSRKPESWSILEKTYVYYARHSSIQDEFLYAFSCGAMESTTLTDCI